MRPVWNEELTKAYYCQLHPSEVRIIVDSNQSGLNRWHALLSRAAEPVVLFPAIALLGLSIVWIGTIELTALQRATAQRAATAADREILGIYEAQVVRALREINYALNLVKYRHESTPARGLLAEMKDHDLLPPDLIFTVSIADADGTIVESTRKGAAESVKDTDFFSGERTNDALIVDRTTRGPSGEPQLRFARRLQRPDGTFDGVVVVAVQADYFVSGYETAKLGRAGLLGLVGTDGTVRIRRTGEEIATGGRVEYKPFLTEPETADSDVKLWRANWDRVTRWTSAREVYGFPVVLLVGLSVDEQMAPAARVARWYYLWASIASAGIVALSAILGRLSWQLSRSRQRESAAKLAHAARVEFLAFHDGLTGLPNRSMFSKVLGERIAQAQIDDRPFAVAFLDMDRFKQINDTLGHEAGDELLKGVADRLRQCVGTGDTVARLGGDEFVIILSQLMVRSHAADVAEKILALLAQPFSLVGQDFRITASIGISVFPQHGRDEQTLKKNADVAMYKAKTDGKNNYRFYSDELNANSLERLALESNLRHALERGELKLLYQAKRDLDSGRIVGMEALLRWVSADLGEVAPRQFLPVAEETGLILPIGKWVLKTACAQNVAWQRTGAPPLCIAINLSARQFIDDSLLPDVTAALKETGMDARLLELEISESLLIRNSDTTLKILHKLKALGVRIAIDDFGTGYTSLTTLQQFPLDTIKIDKAFMHGFSVDNAYAGLADAVIAMGKILSMTVVAQGVETTEQAAFLKEHACDQIQGFYFNRPLTTLEFTKLLLDP